MIKKKKIDIIHVSYYYPPDIGGLELAVENMVKEQLLTNERVQVVAGKDRNKKHPKVDYIIRFNRYAIFRSTPIIPKLFSYLLKTNKKIYFIHYGPPTIAEIGFIISKLKFKKFVIYIHMDAEGSTPFTRFLLNIYHKTIIRFILKRADAIIVPTNSYRNHISKRYGIMRNKIFCILYGFEFKKFSHISKPIHKEFNILFVGNLKIQKNVPLLINAFDILANKFKDMNLIIVGSGREEKSIKFLASRKKNQNRIHFIGAVHNEKLPELYKNADLFVLPSFIESAGIVILEAFAAKVPVVATKCLGVIDLIGNDRGILVKNNDVLSLVEGIKKIYLKKVNVEKMINKAYDFVKSNSWKQMTERINEILRKLDYK